MHRSYRTVFESLQKVWTIEAVPEANAIWRIGHAELPYLSSLRVTVWNICKGAGGQDFELDFRHLLLQSDLMLMQEALLSRKSLGMVCEPGFEALHAASYARADGLRDGVLTLSKASFLKGSKRILCKYKEPVFKTPKATLVQKVLLTPKNIPVLVVNIHATLFRWPSRAGEELEHIISMLPEFTGPMIFAGDFNTISPAFLGVIKEKLSLLGLIHLEIPGDLRPLTQQLDHVFYRGLKVESKTVDISVKSSDHFPIRVVFSVEN